MALLATLITLAAVGPPAAAETGEPRTDAVVSLLAAGTGAERHDDVGGEILTYDLATYRLNVSQNGADSTGDVVANVRLNNGFFADADPSTPALDPPPVCGAGSAISADRTTLTCNLGPLAQGTTVALDYSARASGNITPGDLLDGTVSVGGEELAIPELVITGTPQVDVSKRLVSHERAPTSGGASAHWLTFVFEVRTAGVHSKGGLPLDRVTFTDDWSDIRAKFPNAQLVSGTNPVFPDLTTPVGLNTVAHPRSASGPDTANNEIPNPGTWAASYSNLADTTVDITVEGFDNEIMVDRSLQNMAVTSGAITIRIPDSDVPLDTTNFTNRITNIEGVPRGGGSPVSDYNSANNTADGSTYKVMAAAYRNMQSAWVSSDFGFRANTSAAIFGNWSHYRRPALSPDQWSSGGHQRAYPGQSVKAEAVAATHPERISASIPSMMSCIKFQQPVTSGMQDGNAAARVMGTKLGAEPTIYGSNVTIQYGTISGANAGSTCTNGAANWTTSRPASFNAVRAMANVNGFKTQATNNDTNLEVVLQVPVKVPSSASPGSLRGFWNTAVHGRLTGGSWSTADNTVDGAWLGTRDGSGIVADGTYNIANNTGNNRAGDRVTVSRAVSVFTKSMCDSGGSAREISVGDTGEFCLEAVIEGNGNAGNIRITDDSLVDGAPMSYVPGSAEITGATPVDTEPTQDGSGTYWRFENVAAPTVIKIKFEARAEISVAKPGESWTNVAHVRGPNLPDYSSESDTRNPNIDTQSVQFRTGRYQLNVTKSTQSPDPTWRNTPIVWDLHLTNEGETPISKIDAIDILPFMGDDAQDRVPASNFHGTTGLSEEMTPTATQTIWYSTADPATLSSLPDDPSNDLTNGSAGWDETPPADLSTVTAVRILDTEILIPGSTRVITVPMAAEGNEAEDLYTNDVGALVQEGFEGEDGPILPVRSNDVTVRVQAPGFAIRKETELSEDGTPKPLAVGEENTYTISVFNTGGINEPNAVVTDELRDGLEFVSASDGGVYDEATRTVTWPGRDAPAGDEDTPAFTYTLTVKVERPAHEDLLDESGLIPNTARVNGDHDCIPGDDEDEKCESTVTNPPRNPHIWQDKIVDRDQALPGNVLTYTVTVGNDGDATATSVVAHDVLPDEVTFDEEQTIEVDRGDATYNGDGTITWTIGDLDVDETVTMTFTATINDGKWDTQFVNRVTSSHDPGDCIGSCEPPRVENPCEDDPTASCAPTETPLPSLRQDKVVDLGEALPGDLLTYTVSITNEGTVTAEDYEATDELPEGVTFESATHGGVYDDDTRTIAWSFGEGGLPTLEAGERVDIIVTATIDDDRYSSEFVNRFVVDPPDTWPPTNVDNPCVDEPEKSCAVTVTPDEPPAPVDPADPPKRNSPLPRTGAAIAGTLALGLSALATGSGLLISRRRRTTQ